MVNDIVDVLIVAEVVRGGDVGVAGVEILVRESVQSNQDIVVVAGLSKLVAVVIAIVIVRSRIGRALGAPGIMVPAPGTENDLAACIGDSVFVADMCRERIKLEGTRQRKKVRKTTVSVKYSENMKCRCIVRQCIVVGLVVCTYTHNVNSRVGPQR